MVQAGRDLTFISLSMSGCFSLGALLLLVEIYFLVYWRPFRKIKISLVFFLCINNSLLFVLFSACKRLRFARLLVCTCGISMGKTITPNTYMQKSLICTYLHHQIFFQGRFFLALQRLLSPSGVLQSKNMINYKPEKLKAT